MADIKFIPGVHPTYKEQFDKLTRAYINNEVVAMNPCACFVCNLLNGDKNWESSDVYQGCNLIGWPETMEEAKTKRPPKGFNSIIKQQAAGLYTAPEIYLLEGVFMLNQEGGEDALFRAFSLTLDLLRQIHESKGEIIDEVPAFTKRELKTA